MDDNPYKSPEHAQVEAQSRRPKPPTLLDAVMVCVGASFILFLVITLGVMLLAEWLGVIEWFRVPIGNADPERGCAFWYAFGLSGALSLLFGLVAAKRHLQRTNPVLDGILGLVLLVLMFVLVAAAYLTGGK